MANGRLRTMLAGLHFDLKPRRNRPGVSPHYDAATASLHPCIPASLHPCIRGPLADLSRRICVGSATQRTTAASFMEGCTAQ